MPNQKLALPKVPHFSLPLHQSQGTVAYDQASFKIEAGHFVHPLLCTLHHEHL